MLLIVKLEEERSGFLPVVNVYEFCLVNTYNDTKGKRSGFSNLL